MDSMRMGTETPEFIANNIDVLGGGIFILIAFLVFLFVIWCLK